MSYTELLDDFSDHIWKFAFSSVCAGACISLGAIFQLALAQYHPVAGAVAFSAGLLLVRLFGFYLYTGKCGALPSCERRELLILLFVLFSMFLLNANGTMIVDLLLPEDLLPPRPSPITQGWECLVPAMICGALVHLGTRERTGVLGTILCVAGFILAGGLHCVAETFHWVRNGYPDGGSLWLLKIALGNLIGAVLVYFELGE